MVKEVLRMCKALGSISTPKKHENKEEHLARVHGGSRVKSQDLDKCFLISNSSQNEYFFFKDFILYTLGLKPKAKAILQAARHQILTPT